MSTRRAIKRDSSSKLNSTVSSSLLKGRNRSIRKLDQKAKKGELYNERGRKLLAVYSEFGILTFLNNRKQEENLPLKPANTNTK